MNARQRRELISRRVSVEGGVQIADLMEEFRLTDTTIRRDLSILERMGLLSRVHGAAVSTGKALQVASLERLMNLHSPEKQRIGAAAAEYIHDQDVIILDSGTTVFQLARHIPPELRRVGALRIVTNSTSLVDEVGVWSSPNLLLLGGIYLPEHRATVGPEVLHQLGEISAKVAFLGCDGFTLSGGITTAHPLMAETGRMMAERAEQVIVLADNNKLSRAGFVPIIPIQKINVLITDTGASMEILTGLREQGVKVVLA